MGSCLSESTLPYNPKKPTDFRPLSLHALAHSNRGFPILRHAGPEVTGYLGNQRLSSVSRASWVFPSLDISRKSSGSGSSLRCLVAGEGGWACERAFVQAGAATATTTCVEVISDTPGS